jgi:hypothetical protein
MRYQSRPVTCEEVGGRVSTSSVKHSGFHLLWMMSEPMSTAALLCVHQFVTIPQSAAGTRADPPVSAVVRAFKSATDCACSLNSSAEVFPVFSPWVPLFECAMRYSMCCACRLRVSVFVDVVANRAGQALMIAVRSGSVRATATHRCDDSESTPTSRSLASGPNYTLDSDESS